VAAILSDPKSATLKRWGTVTVNNQEQGGDAEWTDKTMETVPELDPKIQQILGRALKAHYDDLISAPIPDRFLVLLAELEAKEQDHGG
jgi:hypothetical protein